MVGRDGIGGAMMKWTATQHLDLQPVRSGAPAAQPHCATFHHSQALIAVAVGRNIVGASLDPYLTMRAVSSCGKSCSEAFVDSGVSRAYYIAFKITALESLRVYSSF